MRPSPAPIRYEIPTIHGDPAAAYRLADAYRDLAETIAAVQQQTGHIIGGLASSWRGSGHRSIEAPAEQVARSAGVLVVKLRTTADSLDAYGKHLEHAHHHHGISLHKLFVVGAVVAVSATAIVVTLGAATVVEAAAAAAAVGTATEAAAAAGAADLAAAGGIDAAFDAGLSIRPLLAFVVPHLVAAEWNAAAVAGYDEITVGRLKWGPIAETSAVAFVAAGAATRATALAADSGRVTPHLIEGTSWAGAAAADDELVNHRLSLLDVSEAFVLAGGSTVARDALRARGHWPAETDYRREALVNLSHQNGLILNPRIAKELALLRQPPAELARGEVDFRLHEGPGHTIERHIGKSARELLHRVRTDRIPVASTYWDAASAQDATGLTISMHRGLIDRWIASNASKSLRLHATLPYDVGFAINANARVTFVRSTTVILRRDGVGYVVRTSFPRGVR